MKFRPSTAFRKWKKSRNFHCYALFDGLLFAYFAPGKVHKSQHRNDSHQGWPRAKANQTPTQTEQAGTLPYAISGRPGRKMKSWKIFGEWDGKLPSPENELKLASKIHLFRLEIHLHSWWIFTLWPVSLPEGWRVSEKCNPTKKS